MIRFSFVGVIKKSCVRSVGYQECCGWDAAMALNLEIAHIYVAGALLPSALVYEHMHSQTMDIYTTQRFHDWYLLCGKTLKQ